MISIMPTWFRSASTSLALEPGMPLPPMGNEGVPRQRGDFRTEHAFKRRNAIDAIPRADICTQQLPEMKQAGVYPLDAWSSEVSKLIRIIS
jgi:hypothetical protein